MSEWIEKLKTLNLSFSYNDFINLIEEIDKYIIEKKGRFSKEFLINFFSLMELINDNIKNNNQYISLGEYLIDKKLKNHERITPTLLIYWYLKHKSNIGLNNWANEIIFGSLSSNGRMGIRTDNDDGHEELIINWSAIEKEENNDKFNYRILEDVLHEITHLWLNTRNEETEALFEKLAYYYNRISLVLMKKFMGGSNAGNPLIHDSLLNEFMAYEQSKVYMIVFAKNNPEYFSTDILERKQLSYSRSKEISNPPRDNFAFLLNFIKNIYESNSEEEYFNEHYREIQVLQTKLAPIVAELEAQNISELSGDYYWNIFLNDYYLFKENKLITTTDKNKLTN